MVKGHKISVVRTDDAAIEKDDIVTVYYADNFMMITKNHNSGDVGYKKISDSQFLNTRTGEVKSVEKKMSDTRSVKSLRKTFFNLSLLISLNFSGHKSEVFISLTYDRKKTKADCIGRDVKNFWAKLSRFNKSQKLYRCLFLCEYQGSGQPHVHALLKRVDNEKITLSKRELSSLWQNGSVHIQTIYDIDGLIDYLNPFHNQKKMKRLGYYKPHEKIFRCRGSFNRARKLKSTYENAVKLAEKNNLQAYKHESYVVLDGNNLEVNRIQKINYKETQNYE